MTTGAVRTSYASRRPMGMLMASIRTRSADYFPPATLYVKPFTKASAHRNLRLGLPVLQRCCGSGILPRPPLVSSPQVAAASCRDCLCPGRMLVAPGRRSHGTRGTPTQVRPGAFPLDGSGILPRPSLPSSPRVGAASCRDPPCPPHPEWERHLAATLPALLTPSGSGILPRLFVPRSHVGRA